MAKEKKRAGELEDIVRERTRHLDIHHLEVRPDRNLGWGAFIVAQPALLGGHHLTVEGICHELRKQYDLLEE
jgi:hypothetical protein